MKIVDERNKNSVRFDELEVGKVFFFENVDEYGSNPYLSIEDVMSIEEVCFSAIDLVDGQLVSVLEFEEVIPCEAVLTIK